MKIAVIALGKIGLPVATFYACRGHTVVGGDVDPHVVAAVNAGRSHITHEPGLAERLPPAVRAGRLRATVDTAAAVAGAEVVIVLVPLGLTGRGEPDFGPLDRAFAAIAAGLQDGALVLLETTVPAGTSRRRFLPMLERGERRCGQDFAFAFSPERVQSGRVERDLTGYPRVVGGIDAASGERAAAFYREHLGVEVLTLASAEAAEFCKLAESIYRDVNIGLANELARHAGRLGVDFHEVIAAANSQPQSHLHQPGLGVGGHCMPVYPYFLTADRGDAPITYAARAVNDGMHRHAADLLEEALGGLAGRRLLVLGLTYRPGVRELAHSPALALAAEVRRRGAIVAGHDPLLGEADVAQLGFIPAAADGGWPADALVLHTADPAYRELDLNRLPGLQVVLDCAGLCQPEAVAGAGVQYLGIGRPVMRPAAEVSG